MANKSKIINPVAAALSIAFVSSMAASTTAVADGNHFSATDLDAGYRLAGEKAEKGKYGEGKCGEGKCGVDKYATGNKGAEGSCGEKDNDKEGSCGGNV